MSVDKIANIRQRLAEGRSRLQGLKQMSVDKIANIRQRLAEGRRMLRTRSESDELGNSLMTKPECLTNQVGNTRIAVQKDINHDRQFLSGIFCESSQINMLTLHNTELELIPQSVYKLPPNVDRVIVNGSKLSCVEMKYSFLFRKVDFPINLPEQQCKSQSLHLFFSLGRNKNQ